MKHGLAYIYGSSPARSRFDELVQHIEQAGMSLANPSTGKVLGGSSFGETSREDIRARLAKGQKTNFNFYVAEDTNVFCTIQKIDDERLREEFDLSGKTEEESFAVIDVLTNLFMDRVRQKNAFAFVVDEYAEIQMDMGFDWDDFILGERTEPREWPLRLGFSKQFLATKSVPLEKYKREDGENYVILRRLPNG
jgi:hypothetical protein